jgi:hypothetical protein
MLNVVQTYANGSHNTKISWPWISLLFYFTTLEKNPNPKAVKKYQMTEYSKTIQFIGLTQRRTNRFKVGHSLFLRSARKTFLCILCLENGRRLELWWHVFIAITQLIAIPLTATDRKWDFLCLMSAPVIEFIIS